MPLWAARRRIIDGEVVPVVSSAEPNWSPSAYCALLNAEDSVVAVPAPETVPTLAW
jgi:hypothetical protein